MIKKIYQSLAIIVLAIVLYLLSESVTETTNSIQQNTNKELTKELTKAEVVPVAEEMVEIDEAQIDYQAQLELLAMCVEAEAGNQGLEGKRMVAAVVLNRVDSTTFPNSIREVILQRNQFAVVTSGVIYQQIPSEETYEAVRLEIAERKYRQVAYFTAGNYNPHGTPLYKFGDHYFSSE